MKIFISHSSKNANYGQALVDLLVAVGVNNEQIIFTSNDAFGIPTGQNIFNWLRARITEKPYVVYLLSSEYYSSIACLNEMGAAWVVENEHTIIFTPEFKASSPEFQSGALDPREMGFKINNHDRVTGFIETLRVLFPISTKAVFVSQKIREFIEKVNSFEVPKQSLPITQIVKNENHVNPILTTIKEEKIIVENSPNKIIDSNSKTSQVDKLFKDLQEGKLKDEEIILLHYSIDTARFKLGVGWKSSGEIENIKTWEDVNSLNSKLSLGYDEVIRRFELKKLTKVTELTSSNNPREIAFISDLTNLLLGLPEEGNLKIKEALARNESVIPKSWNIFEKEDDLPF
ncbi:toll/interleukin-1 receptor domain-containing protein [Flavobacterium collinsii]|mgnify:CR=1 FL=1|uniref:toll/interleukin-1 receptor domain-containing protein n=1 Tax=Flavobacterium collinsii TaxID=1114861 RepID=UPI0037577F81